MQKNINQEDSSQDSSMYCIRQKGGKKEGDNGQVGGPSELLHLDMPEDHLHKTAGQDTTQIKPWHTAFS